MRCSALEHLDMVLNRAAALLYERCAVSFSLRSGPRLPWGRTMGGRLPDGFRPLRIAALAHLFDRCRALWCCRGPGSFFTPAVRCERLWVVGCVRS